MQTCYSLACQLVYAYKIIVMNINRKIVISAVSVVAAGIGTYLFARRKARNRQQGKQPVIHDAQALIRNVMHKSKEAQAV
jgi:hypothetical protein